MGEKEFDIDDLSINTWKMSILLVYSHRTLFPTRVQEVISFSKQHDMDVADSRQVPVFGDVSKHPFPPLV